jgi:putative DNA primase/helicase
MVTLISPDSSTNQDLTIEDYEELRSSGLEDCHIERLGHFSIENPKEAKKITGIKHRGLVFRYLNPVTGSSYYTSKGKPFYRMKPRDWNEVDRNWHEDPPKYLSPHGEGNRPYWSALIEDFNLKAKKTSIPLEIVEGEKKADSLAAEGFFVVGLAGVWGWLDKLSRVEEIDIPPAQLIEDSQEDQDALKEKLEESRIIPELIDSLTWNNRRVNIAFDSDLWEKPEVRAAATQLALALQGLGAQPYIVRLPGEISGEKNGPDDFKVRHGIEAYRVLCKHAVRAVAGGKTKTLNLPSDPKPLHKIMLAWSVLKDSWRYRPGVGWYHWENSHWVLSSVDEFERELTFFQDAQGWFLIKGMDLTVRQLKSRLLVSERNWNPSHLIGFHNGTLDQRDETFRPHEREDFCTTILPYDYDPEAQCPSWLKFLDEALKGDSQTIELLQAFCKWILVPKSRDRNAEIQKSLDIVGAKGSGKGTFLDVLTALVGPENCGSFKTKTFDNPNYLASLLDKKVAIDYDASGYLADVGTFNQIVSNEAIPIKILFKDAISARLCTVIVRAYNRTLEVPDGSEGLDRRIIVVPFDHQPKEVDLELSEKLQKELSGIFAWAWSVPLPEMKRRLNWAGAVPAVAEASIKRFEANNPEYCFLAEVFPNGHERVKAGDLYASYVEWCKESGYSAKKMRKFIEAIQALGCKRSNKSDGYYFYFIPSMSEIDLIEHMGLKRKTTDAFSDINSPQLSLTVPIPDTAREQLSLRLSLNSSSTVPEAVFSEKTPQNQTEPNQLRNVRDSLNSKNAQGQSQGQLDVYPVRDREIQGQLEPINAVKTHSEKIIGLGDWVKYRKRAPEGAVRVSCGSHKLQVLEFREKTPGTVEALAKRDKWMDGLWIPLKHLEFVEKGELQQRPPDDSPAQIEAEPAFFAAGDCPSCGQLLDNLNTGCGACGWDSVPEQLPTPVEQLPTPVEQLPTPVEQLPTPVEGGLQKGDRCYSGMTGAIGRVTRANSRYTYILWDKDNVMGLGEVQYSASDLEIMRITKGLPRSPG